MLATLVGLLKAALSYAAVDAATLEAKMAIAAGIVSGGGGSVLNAAQCR